MNSLQTDSLSQLPLSWARTNLAHPVFNLVKLPYSSPGWIPTAEIPYHYSFEQIFRDYLSLLPNGFVLQSCSLPLRDYLIRQGCQVAAMGAEAVIDLPWRGKRSVRELSRRGRRHGTAHEIELSAIHQIKLTQLINASPSRQGVQFQHSERSKFDDTTRCFIFETTEKNWLGAITLSTPGPNYVHTELLLRHRDAPVGIMEALITEITYQLALEGVQRLSLGAVSPLPAADSERLFAAHRHPNEMWSRSQLAFRLGRTLKFAFNAEGLWRFKNKFSPRWEPLYLCASPGLSWATVAGLVQEMGYFNLVRNQLLSLWLLTFPNIKLPVPSISKHPVFGMRRVATDNSPLQTPSWNCMTGMRGQPVSRNK